MSWTDEKVEQMLKLRDEGLSCSQIGLVLGVSRNAIIGKVNRMGLATSRKDRLSGGMVKPTRASDRPIHRKRLLTPPRILEMRRLAEKMHAVELHPPAALLPTVPPSEQGVPGVSCLTLLDLQPHHCRYPVNDTTPFLFCGATRLAGKSYCATHDALCWVKAPVRRGRPPKKMAVAA